MITTALTWLLDNWQGLTLAFFIIATVWSEILAWTESDTYGISQAIINALKKLSGRSGE